MMVYLVEDSLLVRERLKDGIREIDAGIRVCEADSAEEAIPGILEQHPDVVMLDLKLLRGSGLDVLRAVAGKSSASSMVVFSSHAQAPYRSRCLAMGADHVFDKSRDFGKVLEVIRGCRNEKEENR